MLAHIYPTVYSVLFHLITKGKKYPTLSIIFKERGKQFKFKYNLGLVKKINI